MTKVPFFGNVRNDLLKILTLKPVDQGIDNTGELFVFFTDDSVEENVLLLFLQPGSLSGDLVPKPLALLDWHIVSFSIFELVDDFLYLFLSLDEVNIVSDPLSTTSFELSVFNTSRSRC